MAELRKVSYVELNSHLTDDDAWMVIDGVVWNISGFALIHPGGEQIIQNNYGKDASKVYNDVHGPGLILKELGEENRVGELDESTVPGDDVVQHEASSEDHDRRPPLNTILNLYDFEDVAREALSAKAWAYASGAANDSLTLAANIDWYRKIFFRPRVLTGVKAVDVSTSILGQKFDVPFFNSPVSLLKLAHPDGEVAIAKATSAMGSTIICPTLASFSIDEMVGALPKGHPFFFQLYVHQNRSLTRKLLESVCALKPQAIIVTVDLPVLGKREANERHEIRVAQEASAETSAAAPKRGNSGQQQARAANAAIDPDLKWEDVDWIRDFTGIPVFVKGIQCAADALQAYQHGCAGIYISNHGGRAVDTAPPSILTLMEIQAACPEVLDKMEVFIDGGIRRGTDILKAICLGASAVCLGRPFFYALAYGQEGVERAHQSKTTSNSRW